MDKIKVLSLFSGYGGAEFSLKKANVNFECIGFSEIDKYAIQCYGQNHEGKNYGDCTKINPNDLDDFDLLTGGFPCQSFSVAGKGRGELDTRGTLFNEIIRIAEVKQPNYMLLENVKGLTNKNHKETFNKILSELKRIGYHVVWKVLNSKDYGIPQNRERVWFVCKLRNIYGVDYSNFEWPEKQELKIFLKDVLEENVDEKYYLSENHLNRLMNSTDIKKKFSAINPEVALTQTARQFANWKGTYVSGNTNPSGKGMNGNVFGVDIAPTVTTNKGEGNKIIQVNNPKHSNNRVYSKEGISPTLNCMGGGNRQPFIQTKPKLITTDKQGNIIKNTPNVGQAHRNYGVNWISPSLNIGWTPKISDLTIRKLTPTECFRLMGFLDDEINLDNLSNTQRYKLAGNGWDINLVSQIMSNLFKPKKLGLNMWTK